MATVRFRALVLVVLALVLATCTSFPTASPTTTTTVPKPLPALDLSATPAGWVPVAYGDLQLSIPSSWAVAYDSALCGSARAPGELWVNPVMLNIGGCLAPTYAKTEVQLQPLGKARLWSTLPRQVINGITVYGGHSSPAADYFVPSLGSQVILWGPLGRKVLETLTFSPRTVALASGPAPVVPSSWHQVTFAGLRFSVPPAWRTQRASWWLDLGSYCTTPGVALSSDVVTLTTDAHPGLSNCPVPIGPPPTRRPGNAVQVDSVLSPLPGGGTFSKFCLKLSGLTACPATSPAYSILLLKVTVPGRSKPVYVSIGLAGNGMVARTILCSLGAASGPVVTPASVLALAKAGMEGTYSAVYKFSGPTSSTENNATVIVAQRAPTGATAWPGGKRGEWAYRLTAAHGEVVEWVVRGTTVEDCWHWRSTKWRCSAGNYPGDVSIGYTIATEPFLPGTAYSFLSFVIESPVTRSTYPNSK